MARTSTVSRSSTRRPQARALATRARVLKAAEELFTRQGYEATPMSEVAEKAKVGVGTLYHHFAEKRALLLALIDDWGDRELEAGRNDAEHERYLGDDPRAAIHSDIERRYESLRKHGSFYLVLLELADREPEVRSRLQRIQQFSIERLRETIERGQRAGVMREELNSLAAAFMIRHTLDMAATEALVRRVSNPAPEQVLKELTEMISRYILKESP